MSQCACPSGARLAVTAYLVSGEVLLVAGTAMQDSQTVLAQKVMGSGMKSIKMRPQV